MRPRLIGHIWPRNSRGNQLLIAQVADGPEILSYAPADRIFDNMKLAVREVDAPFPGGADRRHWHVVDPADIEIVRCFPTDAQFPGDK